MDRNVFVAIALSMSVLLFWGAFFETPKKSSDQQTNQKVEQKNEQGSIAPTINQPQIIKKITREESINSSKRIKIENDSIVGSVNLKGALIDDISFKKHKQKVEDGKNIIFLNLSCLLAFLGIGTKSIPWLPPSFLNGWHFKILFTPNLVPIVKPWVLSASIKYSEQVGKNLHLLPNSGDIKYW